MYKGSLLQVFKQKIEHYRIKYVQIVKRQKSTPKNAIFRIFCELHVKMSPGSR